MREALLSASGALLIAVLNEWRASVRARTARMERAEAAAAVTEEAVATRQAVESIKDGQDA